MKGEGAGRGRARRVRMNVVQKLARWTIESAFELSVATIGCFNDMSRFRRKVDTLRECGAGSLGKEVADILDRRGLTLVPGYESHDLKHALLGFDMNAEGEVRMQAFMIGNGNHSVPSFAIFIFGAALLPDLWQTFLADFREGRRTRPISAWTIDRYASDSLAALRAATTRNRARGIECQPSAAIGPVGRVSQEGAGPAASANCVASNPEGRKRYPLGDPGRAREAWEALNSASCFACGASEPPADLGT